MGGAGRQERRGEEHADRGQRPVEGRLLEGLEGRAIQERSGGRSRDNVEENMGPSFLEEPEEEPNRASRILRSKARLLLEEEENALNHESVRTNYYNKPGFQNDNLCAGGASLRISGNLSGNFLDGTSPGVRPLLFDSATAPTVGGVDSPHTSSVTPPVPDVKADEKPTTKIAHDSELFSGTPSEESDANTQDPKDKHQEGDRSFGAVGLELLRAVWASDSPFGVYVRSTLPGPVSLCKDAKAAAPPSAQHDQDLLEHCGVSESESTVMWPAPLPFAWELRSAGVSLRPFESAERGIRHASGLGFRMRFNVALCALSFLAQGSRGVAPLPARAGAATNPVQVKVRKRLWG